jgi:asparagine synthase (glutamine-hydrolysing)
MRGRYLLLAGQSVPGAAEALSPRLPVGFRQGFSGPGLRAFVNGGCACLPIGKKGCVLGTLFAREHKNAVNSLSDADAQAITASRGTLLLSRFWGSYVAALAGGDSIQVMRDPSGALPCFFVEMDGGAAFASDAELLVETGFTGIGIDWNALAMHFYAGGLPTPLTVLSGVSELLPGFAIETGGACRQTARWSPWDHVAQIEREEESAAADGLATAVKRCATALAANHDRLLVSVSGGLDSSIVAAALAAAGADATCLTLYGEDPESDERPFARAVCSHLRLPLVERPYRIEDIDLGAPLAPHLPRPSDRTHALSYERAHLEIAGEIGAQAFVTGNGGDSVFGYSQSAAAIADRYLEEGVGRGLIETLRDVCVQTGCGLIQAASNAVRIARGPRSYLWRGQGLFLRPEIVSLLGCAPLTHRWLDAPPGALPGKAAHIASILRLLQCLEPGRGRVLPVLNPLLAQPVVETCLSVPSWAWRSGGRDRSLARRAFAADLPPTILRRHVKGGPDGFTARIVDRFRDEIRQRLLDGHLARQKIIDREAIAAELDGGAGGDGARRARILELVAAEAWIANWLSRTDGAALGQDRERPIEARSLSQCASSSLCSGAGDRSPRSQ